MPKYEVLHNSHRTSDGEVHEPGSVVCLTEMQAQPFVFKLRRLEDKEPPQLETAAVSELKETTPTPGVSTVVVEPAVEVEATPAASRLAAEAGIALTALTGTGKDGRVTVSDVRIAMEG